MSRDPGANVIRALMRKQRRERAAVAETALVRRLAEAQRLAVETPASESLALQQHIGLGMRDATAEEINEACAAWERNGGHL